MTEEKKIELGEKGMEALRRIEEEFARRPAQAPVHRPAPEEPLVERSATKLSPNFFVDIARKLGADVEPAETHRPPCLCGKPMKTRGEVCQECVFNGRVANWRERFRKDISAATSSFDPTGEMGWCRAGQPLYLKAIDKGRREASLLQDDARERAMRLLVDARWTTSDKSVVLLGKTGLGKTMATIAIGHRIIDRAATVIPVPRDGSQEEQDRARQHAAVAQFAIGIRFTTAAKLVAEAHAHPFGRGEPPLMKQAKEATLLVLDEVGRCRVDPIRDLIFERYEANRAPIVMTGSVTAEEFAAWLGPEGLRRIEDSGHVIDLSQRAW